MSRVIAFVACGFTLAACSASVPSLDFLKSSPSTAALRFESVPPGAQVKVSGQSCRTPCELTVEVSEISATFTHKGYQPQTISVHLEEGVLSAARFIPNPVHADLRPVVASKHTGKELGAAAANRSASASASADPSAPSSDPEFTAGIGNNTAWNPGDIK
jgi:hypothetical protein